MVDTFFIIRSLEDDFTLNMLKDYLQKDIFDIMAKNGCFDHSNYIIYYSLRLAESFCLLGSMDEYCGIKCKPDDQANISRGYAIVFNKEGMF